MKKNLAEKIDVLREEMEIREKNGKLIRTVQKRVENQIKIYEQQIRVLSENNPIIVPNKKSLE